MKGRLILLALASLAALAVVGLAAGDVNRIHGTDGPDTIIGTQGPDAISALKGADTIDAEGGNDRVYAGEGNDVALENASEHDVFMNCETVVRVHPTAAQAADDNV